MGCSRALSVLINIVVAAGFLAVLAPQIYWAKVDDNKISLWQNCTSFSDGNSTGLNTTIVKCEKYGLSQDDMKSEYKSLLDGCRAACVMVSFFSLVGMALTCCRRKYSAVFISVIVVLFAAAAIGSFVQFMKQFDVSWNNKENDSQHKYTPWIGLMVASGGLALSVLGTVSACCVTKIHDDYEAIA